MCSVSHLKKTVLYVQNDIVTKSMKIHVLCATTIKKKQNIRSPGSYCSVIDHKTPSLLDLFYFVFKLGYMFLC